MLQQFFEENSIRAIKQIPIPGRATPDTLVWLGETSGNFSVKSSYLTEHGDRFDQKYNQVRKKLWESKLHERLKNVSVEACKWRTTSQNPIGK